MFQLLHVVVSSHNMRPGPLYVAAGALFSIAWFFFFDGLTFASRYDLPYTFPMWLPGILCLVGTIVFLFADPKDVQGEEDFLGGMTDESKQNRAKVTFFLGAVFCLAGLSVGIWKITDTYNNSGTSWPGIALLLQCLSLIGVNGLAIAARAQRSDDYVM